MSGALLVYGATGYTGGLVARRAVERGLRPTLAGRSEALLAPLAQELGLPHRTFPLDAPQAVAAGLEGVAVVLHCAGPFSRTARPMVEACLARRAHYLDITGEVEVFEAVAARDAEARRAGVMLLPGAGFDVVPSDCLASHVKSRLPTATSLRLAMLTLGGFSRGTLTTIVENIHRGGLVRRNGVLTPVPPGAKTRLVDFGRGKRPAVLIPWGDLATAFRSTGIPNIEVYLAARWGVRAALRASGVLGGILASPRVQAILKRRIQAGPPGPTAEERERGRCVLWAEAADHEGRTVTSRLRTPEGYRLTAEAAVALAERVLRGEVSTGFQTPSLAYGKDFVLTLEGVTREDA